jgi:glycosyltransferase involved in cell wall biosynthesis
LKDFEVLVCDDGSTDNSEEIVSRYADRLVIKYRWAENFGGPARPRNVGLHLASGLYVAFLDSDDWWMPGKLAESVKCLEQGADIVYHDLHWATRHGQRLFWRKSVSRALSKPVFDDLIVNGNALNNSSVVVRRELLQKIGGFSEDKNLIAAEDYDAWLRLAKITDAFVRVAKPLGYYWAGDGNISSARRTISTTEALEALYSKELSDLRDKRGLHWLMYIKARAHYLLGSYEITKKTLATINQRRIPVSTRMKILWMRIMMRVRTLPQR